MENLMGQKEDRCLPGKNSMWKRTKGRNIKENLITLADGRNVKYFNCVGLLSIHVC